MNVHQIAGQEVFEKLVDKYAARKDGKMVRPQGPTSFQVNEEKVKEYNKELKEFLDAQVEVECNQLTLKDVEDVKLSPGNFMVMEDCFHNLAPVNE